MDSKPSNKTNIKEILERNIVYVILMISIASFSAGVGAYKMLLEITNQETVIKGSYILKSELAGTILKNEAVREIDFLIDTGQSVVDDEGKTRVWLMQVLAFIHGLNLEKDYEWDGMPMSAIEADIRYAFLDESIEIQAQKTLGILKGFRAAIQTQAYIP